MKILSYCPKIERSEKIIVVVGLPATGKTILADTIVRTYQTRPLKVFRTDDYIKHGFEESLYVLMADLNRDISPMKLIEGVQGYRLLRKGLETNSFFPDLVIVCCATRDIRATRYKERGKTINKGFDTMLEKVWQDYIHLLSEQFIKSKQPRFIMYDTITGKKKDA